MKQYYLILLTLFGSVVAFAQNSNPYEIFGHNSKVKYEMPVSEMLYIRNSDTSSNVKALAFDIENNKVKLLDANDSILNEVNIEADQLLRWLSVDPLAQKYPQHSPYNFVVNNPINALDPNGKDVVFLVDKEGAGGNGHMGMLFQDKVGNWYYFTQGAAENGSQSGFISGSNYAGGVGIMPMQTVSKSGDIIQMTKEQAIAFVQSGGADGTKYDNNITLKTSNRQDATITKNAYSLQKDFQTKKEQYNVYTNNCVDAVQDVVEGTKGTKTGITLPNDLDPRPNEYFKQLQSSVPWMNGDLKLLTIPSTMDNIPARQIVVPNIQQNTIGQ